MNRCTVGQYLWDAITAAIQHGERSERGQLTAGALSDVYHCLQLYFWHKRGVIDTPPCDLCRQGRGA